MRARTALLGSLLTLALTSGAAVGVAAPSVPRTDTPRPSAEKPQTSDGVPGAVPVVPLALARATARRADVVREQLAPGITYTAWDQTDARGPVKLFLLAATYDAPGVRLNVSNPGHVAQVATVFDQAERTGALAAVNGDFYDIGKTGAPLGVMRGRGSGLANARTSGWNSAFYLTRSGTPQIGTIGFDAVIKQHRDLSITNFNSHFVAPGGIGIYTPRWGSSPGYDVTQGQQRDIRRVLVRDGKVVAKGTKLKPGNTIKGTLLIGRGAGASALNRLKVGSAATISWWLPGSPSLVITGSRFLVDDGVVRVVDDKQMEPRTAIGIDRDTHEILILAVDGRQKQSRGYTMVELANEMIDLGADEALNLDGGGSTTMVTRDAAGALAVRNSPSDHFQRRVANVVTLAYRPE